MAVVVAVVVVRNRAVRTRVRSHSEHHSVPGVVSGVVSVVVSAVSVVSYNASEVFSVHYKIKKHNQVGFLCFYRGFIQTVSI